MEPTRISIADVKGMMDRKETVFLLDTRSPDSWNASEVKIAGATRMHFSEIERRAGELPQIGTIVTYCT